MTTYQLAYVDGGTGDFDVVERFEADSDDEANAYAAENAEHPDDWYVLDERGNNINS